MLGLGRGSVKLCSAAYVSYCKAKQYPTLCTMKISTEWVSSYIYPHSRVSSPCLWSRSDQQYLRDSLSSFICPSISIPYSKSFSTDFTTTDSPVEHGMHASRSSADMADRGRWCGNAIQVKWTKFRSSGNAWRCLGVERKSIPFLGVARVTQ
jgi:hypothetical protein